jgi:hypothetical protein
MNTLFLISLVIEFFFSMGFVLMPSTLAGFFGENLTGFGVIIARLFGSALLGLVVLMWFGRSSNNPDTKRAVLASMFTYYVISSVFAVSAQFSGTVSPVGWGTVVLRLSLMIAFGIFLLRRK